MQFIDFLGIYPSTKMAITPLLVDQIEKFQCLKLSTAKDLSPETLIFHETQSNLMIAFLLGGLCKNEY